MTQEVQDKICEALRLGNTMKASCAYAGISEDSFANYRKDSSDFADAVKKAEADCETAHVANIKRAGLGYEVTKTVTKTREVEGVAVTETTTTKHREFSWQASAWWLERRRPEDYARFILDVSKLSAKQIADLLGDKSGSESTGDSSEGNAGN